MLPRLEKASKLPLLIDLPLPIEAPDAPAPRRAPKERQFLCEEQIRGALRPWPPAHTMQAQSLFEDHLQWAESIAHKIGRGLPPSFDVPDLEQSARIEHWN